MLRTILRITGPTGVVSIVCFEDTRIQQHTNPITILTRLSGAGRLFNKPWPDPSLWSTRFDSQSGVELVFAEVAENSAGVM